MVAVIADKLSPTWEKTSKSIIFLRWPSRSSAPPPSGGSSTTPETTTLACRTPSSALVGIDPVRWLQTETFQLNDLLLMVILVWLQVGFSMVLLSAAIKSVPEETLEAARIDGATELQTFFRVVVPQIRGTLISVFITVLILVMKVFDVVYVMTNGEFGTNVIGLEFFKQIFQFSNNGIASAIVVLLMLAVIPVLIYQVRYFKEEEATR
jgi:alpha-glucoside transport system permease protein